MLIDLLIMYLRRVVSTLAILKAVGIKMVRFSK